MRWAWVLLLFAVLPIKAANSALSPDPAIVQRLASTDRWHALLHINPGATLRGVGQSYVDDSDFFIAANGARDPAAELSATWRALAPAGSPARCRYPARYRFLAEKLEWRGRQPLAHCKQYHQWRARMPVGQLVLVFPAAYLNSPSSMFGHTLLRLDDSPDPDSVYLSRAISFGARTGGDDGSVMYIWRGLAGGYPGRFSVASYAKKIHEYGFLENRDIWEYALNLDRNELDWLVRHLWELRGVNFDYYFFDENCSFRLLELIKVARPSAPLLDGQRIAELPVNTVRQLYAADMIGERRYRPSKVNALEHLAAQLHGDERQLAQALAANLGDPERSRLQRLAPTRRHLVAKVAYQALRVRARDQPRTEAVARKSLALLRVVQRNPAPAIANIAPPSPPESGHGTHLLALAGGTQDGTTYGEVGFRMTYHDVLDPASGYLPGAGIEGFNLRLRASGDGQIDLQRLDLVKIRSIAPRSTFVKPISWFVHGGLAQTPVRRDSQLGLFLQGGPGLSWRFGPLMPYALTVGRLESVATQEPTFALGGGAQLGALWVASELQLGVRLSQLYFAQGFDRRRAEMTADVPFSKNNAVRASCGYESWRSNGQTDCTLEWRHFF